MPIKDTQGDLSHDGKGGMAGLPPSGFTAEVVKDTAPNGTNVRGGGSISTDRTSENH